MLRNLSLNNAVCVFQSILETDHPELFGKPCKRPWKIGMREDVKEAYFPVLEEMASRMKGGVSNNIDRIVNRALSALAQGMHYKLSLLKNTHRYNLEGVACEEITREDRRHALNEVARIKHLMRKKRKAKKSNQNETLQAKNLREAELEDKVVVLGEMHVRPKQARTETNKIRA